jgi:hypothetical protein
VACAINSEIIGLLLAPAQTGRSEACHSSIYLAGFGQADAEAMVDGGFDRLVVRHSSPLQGPISVSKLRDLAAAAVVSTHAAVCDSELRPAGFGAASFGEKGAVAMAIFRIRPPEHRA